MSSAGPRVSVVPPQGMAPERVQTIIEGRWKSGFDEKQRAEFEAQLDECKLAITMFQPNECPYVVEGPEHDNHAIVDLAGAALLIAIVQGARYVVAVKEDKRIRDGLFKLCFTSCLVSSQVFLASCLVVCQASFTSCLTSLAVCLALFAVSLAACLTS